MPSGDVQQPPEFYFNAKGEKVPLVRASDLYAVRFKPGARSDSSTIGPEARRVLANSQHTDFIAHYGMQIYRTGPGFEPTGPTSDNGHDGPPAAALPATAGTGIAAAIRSLDEDATVDFATPVFQSPDSNDVVLITNRFAVEFKPGVTKDEIDQLNTQFKTRIVEPLGYALDGAGYVLEAPAGDGAQGPIELSKRYFESGKVVYAVPDLIRRRAFRGPNPAAGGPGSSADSVWPYQPQQWQFATAKIDEAWGFGLGDPSIVVAVADDGVDVAHPEFADRVLLQYDFETNLADASPKQDTDNHGTACAGVAVAAGVQARGVAPLCKLLAVRTPAYLGSVDEGRMFQWIADNNADVISCSWGPPDGRTSLFPLPDNVASAMHYCLVRGRGGKGIPIFWAAGNGNESVSTDGYACNPDVMTIGASTERDVRAYYSNFGPEIFLCAPSSGRKADQERRIFTIDRLGPPGYNPGDANLGDLQGNYTNGFGGTSAAAPLMAGVAALLLSANPELRYDEVRQILQQTADKIGPAAEYDAHGHSPNFGFGRINAGKALQAARAGAGRGSGVVHPPAGGPSITAVASAIRSQPSPVFTVRSGPNPFYAVEVATDALLFDAAQHGFERTTSNFYASWQAAGLTSDPTYSLPGDAWDQLKFASRLYYRMISSASQLEWINAQATTPDARAGEAPSISINDDSVPNGPSIQGPPRTTRSGTPPSFRATGGPNPYYAIELATEARLFNDQNAADRKPETFYASWQSLPLFNGSDWTVPGAAWQKLNWADRLYYRLLSSASRTSWTNPAATTPGNHAEQAPYVLITDEVVAPVAKRFKLDETRRNLRGESLGAVSPPTINGPDTYPRSAEFGPAFLVWLGDCQHWGIEIATDASLLADGADQSLRAASNFFASCGDRLLPVPEGAGTSAYTVPTAAWHRLLNAKRLYYRAVVTKSVGGQLMQVRSDQRAEATLPFVKLVGHAGTRIVRVFSRPEEDRWRDETS